MGDDMKKTVTTTERVTRTFYICDVCGGESEHAGDIRPCAICGIDVCAVCRKAIGSHPNAKYYCLACFEVGSGIRGEIDVLKRMYERQKYTSEEQYKADRAKLMDEWHSKALEEAAK